MKNSSAIVGAVVAGLLLAAAGTALAQERPQRTVTVKLAVDRSIPDLVNWRGRANGFLEGPMKTLRTRFGLRLAIGDPVRWQPENGQRTMAEALGELRTKVQPGGLDIVLGIIAAERISPAALGIASYPHGYILLTDRTSLQAMEYAFLHEVCHIFGAIDLKDRGSVMAVAEPGLAVDGFTARTILLNRDRSFDRNGFPLSKSALDDAIALYRERTEQGSGGEPEARLFLTLLYLEKDDVESAAQACEEAAGAAPRLTGLHVLLGNIRLRQKRTELAIQEYGRALEAQPAEAGIHFNLGLAYIQARLYGQAMEECRAALEINGNFIPARLMHARLLLATGNGPAAVTAARAAVKSDPRSAEALCVLGTVLLAESHPFLPVPGAGTEAGREAEAAPDPGSSAAELARLEAITLLQKSIALDPNDPEAHVGLGSAYAVGHRYPEAEAEFLEALRIAPNDLSAHFSLGGLYFETGQVRKAAFHLERIIEIDPGSDLGSRIIAQTYHLPQSYVLAARDPIR